ncbi:1059_t:CDS:2 [Acaulospora colombiana]|uniref:1059_t:CDS:1 n=1 Tax=Acaulospora colombiana TaxID=27376 RepID=A0ACA9K0I0_9GLOM|nr:1059_t:CDS:2 [Acaulospora colombiana]
MFLKLYTMNSKDFPDLFGSNGLFKDELENFDTNLEEFRSFNKKSEEVREEMSKLKNEIKTWMQRRSQFTLALKNINEVYPSEVPPEDQKDDKTYQERYKIAQTFISEWKACVDKIQDFQKTCDEIDEFWGETIQKNKYDMNKTLDQLAGLSLSNSRFRSLTYNLFKRFIPSTSHKKRRGCLFSARLTAPMFKSIIRVKNLFNEIQLNMNGYRDDVTATNDKIGEYRESVDGTILHINRIRMARTPAYSNQARLCSICNKPYVFLKWCKFCDREQFRQQFSSWESGNPELDEVIRGSQLSIKYPNGYILWIPYESFINITFLGCGAFAKVYRADWVEGLGTWDYALGKRVQYRNTPVALKVLNNSKNMRENFLEEVIAYIKSSSSTVLRCYGISKDPETSDYIMVFPYAHGGNLRKYMEKELDWGWYIVICIRETFFTIGELLQYLT